MDKEEILKNPREWLFSGVPPCSNHSCIIKKPVGLGTNGPCHCFTSLTRARQNLIGQKLDYLLTLLENKND